MSTSEQLNILLGKNAQHNSNMTRVIAEEEKIRDLRSHYGEKNFDFMLQHSASLAGDFLKSRETKLKREAYEDFYRDEYSHYFNSEAFQTDNNQYDRIYNAGHLIATGANRTDLPQETKNTVTSNNPQNVLLNSQHDLSNALQKVKLETANILATDDTEFTYIDSQGIEKTFNINAPTNMQEFNMAREYALGTAIGNATDSTGIPILKKYSAQFLAHPEGGNFFPELAKFENGLITKANERFLIEESLLLQAKASQALQSNPNGKTYLNAVNVCANGMNEKGIKGNYGSCHIKIQDELKDGLGKTIYLKDIEAIRNTPLPESMQTATIKTVGDMWPLVWGREASEGQPAIVGTMQQELSNRLNKNYDEKKRTLTRTFPSESKKLIDVIKNNPTLTTNEFFQLRRQLQNKYSAEYGNFDFADIDKAWTNRNMNPDDIKATGEHYLDQIEKNNDISTDNIPEAVLNAYPQIGAYIETYNKVKNDQNHKKNISDQGIQINILGTKDSTSLALAAKAGEPSTRWVIDELRAYYINLVRDGASAQDALIKTREYYTKNGGGLTGSYTKLADALKKEKDKFKGLDSIKFLFDSSSANTGGSHGQYINFDPQESPPTVESNRVNQITKFTNKFKGKTKEEILTTISQMEYNTDSETVSNHIEQNRKIPATYLNLATAAKLPVSEVLEAAGVELSDEVKEELGDYIRKFVDTDLQTILRNNPTIKNKLNVVAAFSKNNPNSTALGESAGEVGKEIVRFSDEELTDGGDALANALGRNLPFIVGESISPTFLNDFKDDESKLKFIESIQEYYSNPDNLVNELISNPKMGYAARNYTGDSDFIPLADHMEGSGIATRHVDRLTNAAVGVSQMFQPPDEEEPTTETPTEISDILESKSYWLLPEVQEAFKLKGWFMNDAKSKRLYEQYIKKPQGKKLLEQILSKYNQTEN